MRPEMLHQFPAFWVLTGPRERYKLVETVDTLETVDAAAWLLMHLWPSNKGGEYIDALDAYRDALFGVALANTGREAPMRAADEACVARGGALSCR
ncbi:DUF982 domain-containing protein [Rhizobium sp. PL01]|uniref:DUF982 domain-containing protein n=1 Tax=Rhizobium sp. PL01 TaxID=3085631 RepID=UPI002981EE58|nr:DUF982 domain-containing protein [Rhizobium sp. PL01]MDW5317192.1 DUF982 domain-containing protein [Rhizobium sp. PL01]